MVTGTDKTVLLPPLSLVVDLIHDASHYTGVDLRGYTYGQLLDIRSYYWQQETGITGL